MEKQKEIIKSLERIYYDVLLKRSELVERLSNDIDITEDVYKIILDMMIETEQLLNKVNQAIYNTYTMFDLKKEYFDWKSKQSKYIFFSLPHEKKLEEKDDIDECLFEIDLEEK